MKDGKLIGLSIIIGSLIIAAAILIGSRMGRYQFQPSSPPGVIWVLDTVTGEVETR